MKSLIASVLVISLAATVSAQLSDKAELEAVAQGNSLGVKPVSNPFSLLDFSRIKWSHSYSVSYFSGGGNSGSIGMFNSRMFYELSPKLSLTLDIGIAHTGGFSSGEGRDATLLPGFTLDYHPSEKFRMTFMVQKYNGCYNPLFGRSSLWHNPIGP